MTLIPPLVFAVCALSACATKQDTLPEDRFAGSWRNADGLSISFEDTGVMSVDRPGPRMKAILGDWSVSGEVITIRYRPESKVCVDDVGQYRVDFQGDTFTATALNESCDPRRKALEGVWKRTAAGRVTPGG